MNVKVVIGANYGDEGKGLVSGCLARQAAKNNEKVLTVFYNGTMQRAHTFEGEVHRSMAAGTKYGTDTYYHHKFVIDPISILLLQAKPIIDPMCRVILPCDVLKNRSVETSRGAARHGSCGFGLFEAVKRSTQFGFCVRAIELKDPYSLYNKLKDIEKKYPTPADDLYNLHNFTAAVDYINSKCKIEEFDKIVREYDTVIYEGGQGLLLDQFNKDCFPHLTPSSTGSTFIVDDIKKITEKPELFYVSRSYMTRHGAGPMECECQKEDINKDITDSTNIENEFQGSLRFGKINVDTLKERILNDAGLYNKKKVNLVLTQLNYTDNQILTTSGFDSLNCLSFSDSIYVSDQKDQMECLD